jgi:hypothetical protein
VEKLDSSDRWFRGATFLSQTEDKWPELKAGDNAISEEAKAECFIKMMSVTKEPVVDINRFSSWTKLLRVTAYVRRFIRMMKNQISNVKELSHSPVLI